MDITALDRELRGTVGRVPRPDFRQPRVRLLARYAAAHRPPVHVTGVDTHVVDDGRVRWRLHVPEQRSGAALVWLHGGGLVAGAAALDDRLCAETARGTGIVVASVDYRHAPEHPFPAAHDDAYAVWSELRGHARRLAVDTTRIVVGGQGAGGGLAAALAQRLHDEGSPARAQWLMYPMLDDRTAARINLDPVRHFIWDNRANRFAWSAFLGGPPGAGETPRYSVAARRPDLTGLPPAWIGVGDIDLVHDESVAYAERLRTAGVDTTLDVVAGAPHEFGVAAPAAALTHDFLGRATRWLVMHA